MFKIFYLIIISFVFCGCVYKPYFKTPNDVNETEATVYLNNGTVLNGLLSIVFENDMDEGKIYLIPQNSKAKQFFKIKDISSYTIDSSTYVPKLVDLYMMGSYHFLFLKRLTKESDRIQLYELHQLYKSNSAGEENWYYFFSFHYFSKYEVVDINSSKVLPNFDIKMSHYVEDCPQLVENIQNKHKAFYYSSSALRSKREEVIKNIVMVYNSCK